MASHAAKPYIDIRRKPILIANRSTQFKMFHNFFSTMSVAYLRVPRAALEVATAASREEARARSLALSPRLLVRPRPRPLASGSRSHTACTDLSMQPAS